MIDLNNDANRLTVRRIFPNLADESFVVSSPEDSDYNCIAWAIGDEEAFWDPTQVTMAGKVMGGIYWPSGVALTNELPTFIEVFSRQGFEECGNGHLEGNLEKIALYVDSATGLFRHVARQLESGEWTSKLGGLHDIEHLAPSDLAGDAYGEPTIYMARPRKRYPHPRLGQGWQDEGGG
jgi:hypothetical protein